MTKYTRDHLPTMRDIRAALAVEQSGEPEAWEMEDLGIGVEEIELEEFSLH